MFMQIDIEIIDEATGESVDQAFSGFNEQEVRERARAYLLNNDIEPESVVIEDIEPGWEGWTVIK